MRVYKEISKTRNNQRGLVSIVVTMIIIVVLSLIVIGFARLTRRAQIQTLDRQLNTQAQFAAETGINDATQALALNPALLEPDDPYDKCDGPTSFIEVAGIQDKTNLEQEGVSYTCLLVDPAPKVLTFQNVAPLTSEVFPVESKNNIDRIEINFEDPESNNETCTMPGSNHFPPRSGWNCQNPILRIDVIADRNTTNRNNMKTRTATLFAYPENGGFVSNGRGFTIFSNSSGPANQGRVKNASCTPDQYSRKCRLIIDVSAENDNKFFLRLTPIYRSATLDISATASGEEQNLIGVQSVIDVTGIAQDVLKRIRVHSSLFQANNAPFTAVQSGTTLCKLLRVIPDDKVTSDAGCDVDFPAP